MIGGRNQGSGGPGRQRLRQALALEREALRRVQALLAELEDDDPDRVVLQRHRDKLQAAIADLERLVGGS